MLEIIDSFSNVNLLTNNNLILLNNQWTYSESSQLIFTETWRTQLIPDANVELLGFTTVRAGRDTHVP